MRFTNRVLVCYSGILKNVYDSLSVDGRKCSQVKWKNRFHDCCSYAMLISGNKQRMKGDWRLDGLYRIMSAEVGLCMYVRVRTYHQHQHHPPIPLICH
jgi:hypothetical protein